MTQQKILKGRDVSAPVRHVTHNGRTYPMVYNNTTARLVEDVYADIYGHPEKGYYDVLDELAVPKHRAVMAMAYAAIHAADPSVTWEEFDASFRITDIEGMREAMQSAVLESLPDPEDDGEAKNADAAPEDRSPTPDTPGRG